MVAWCLAAPVFVGLAYVLLVPILRRGARPMAKGKATD
jgi:hypothetical protein